MESYTTQVPKTDDKGQPVMTNIAVTVQAPKLDTQGKPVMSNGAPVMVEAPQQDAQGHVLMTNVPVMVDAQVTTQLDPHRPGGVADRHQTPRHQRRRFFRPEQRPSL